MMNYPPLKYSVIFLLLLIVHELKAQQKKQFSVDLSRSLNGTGDMKGYGFSAEFGKYLKSNIEFTTALGANIHSSQLKITINSTGQTTDASLRFVQEVLIFPGY
ncbi:MAG: hypothetical protein ABIN97_03715 [Ginsengibacter sp.]